MLVSVTVVVVREIEVPVSVVSLVPVRVVTLENVALMRVVLVVLDVPVGVDKVL
jgi:hypothetical protein